LKKRRLADWNARYRSGEEIASDPAPLLVRAAESLPPGRALDLACGAGRNASWLARRGWEVVAIDGASEAIRIVHEHDAAIDARVMDLETGAALPFEDESFDLVAILFYLHRPLFAEARRLVRRGGVVVCAARMQGTYRIGPGELARTFADFEVLYSSEGEIAEIVARKSPEGDCGSTERIQEG
jgi:SAM-dependent methyltransferase